jgi:hypothetical protein
LGDKGKLTSQASEKKLEESWSEEMKWFGAFETPPEGVGKLCTCLIGPCFTGPFIADKAREKEASILTRKKMESCNKLHSLRVNFTADLHSQHIPNDKLRVKLHVYILD